MKFTPYDGPFPLRGRCTYSETDWAFDFVSQSTDEIRNRVGGQGIAIIAVGTIQLEVSIEFSTVLYVWGYHGSALGRRQQFPIIQSRPRGIRVDFGRAVQAGVAYRVPGSDDWSTLHDPESGWVYIGAGTPGEPGDYCEFAEGEIAFVVDGQLRALFLRPTLLNAPLFR